jgi:hypothetical protein
VVVVVDAITTTSINQQRLVKTAPQAGISLQIAAPTEVGNLRSWASSKADCAAHFVVRWRVMPA